MTRTAAAPNSVPAMEMAIPGDRTADMTSERLAKTLLAIALLNGVALMVPMLTAGPLVLDEHGTYWLVSGGPLTLWERSLRYENIPPLSPWLDRLSMNLLGETEWAFRMPAVIWYLLAIGFSYLLGREAGRPVWGGLCALVTAWHPTALHEIRIARCYSLSLLLTTVCFWAALRWIRKPASHMPAVIWCLSAVAAVWTHYLNVAVIAASFLGIMWRVAIDSKRAAIHAALALLLVALCLLPLTSSYARMADWGRYFAYQQHSPLLETISPLWWLGLPVGFVLRGLIRSARLTGRDDCSETTRTHWLLMVTWGLVPALGAAVICHGNLASLANPRYRIGFETTSACLFVMCLADRLKPRTACVVVLIALTAAWVPNSNPPWQPRRLAAPQALQWKEMAEHIQTHGNPDEPIFVQSGLGEGFLLPRYFDDRVLHDYTACRMGRFYLKADHPRFALPYEWAPHPDMTEFYGQLIRDNQNSSPASLWIAAATDTDLNRISVNVFERMLRRQGYRKTARIPFEHAELIHYRFTGAVPAAPQPQ